MTKVTITEIKMTKVTVTEIKMTKVTVIEITTKTKAQKQRLTKFL